MVTKVDEQLENPTVPPLIGGRAQSSPEEHALIVRDDRFCRTDRPSRWWMNGDPVATAWYNSVSASLPRGEAFFIDTMKTFRDEMPRGLATEVRDFIRQEINHTREHVAFNRIVADHGYDVESIERGITDMLSLAEGRPREVNLAVSIALEHFAASISHELLADPSYLADAEHEPAELWRWHAAEEIEHKGLVFEVWLHVTRDWSAWKRWKTMALVSLLITRKYFRNRVRDALGLMAQDGLTGWRARARLYWHLWGNPGLIRRLLPHWGRILLPGFKPWDFDNSNLIRLYRRKEQAAAPALVPAE
jgi:uncharacterized protein